MSSHPIYLLFTTSHIFKESLVSSLYNLTVSIIEFYGSDLDEVATLFVEQCSSPEELVQSFKPKMPEQ